MSQLKRVAIVGLGQIGGSLGYDLMGRGLAAEVLGLDRDPEIAARARAQGAVSACAPSLEKALEGAQIVILATPIKVTHALLPEVARLAEPPTVVVDVAGTRRETMRHVAESPFRTDYVGAHPMAGSEGIGFGSARGGLFDGCRFILTPDDRAGNDAVKLVEQLVEGLGASHVTMPPEDHDRLVALTCHLPYAVAVCLCRLLGREATPQLEHLIGPSIRSAGRVARSSQELTSDMFTTNRVEVTDALGLLIEELIRLRIQIDQANARGLQAILEDASRFANSLREDG